MPVYRYTLLDQMGRKKSGTVRAADKEAVETALRARLCDLLDLVELDDEGAPLESEDERKQGLPPVGLGLVLLLVFSLIAFVARPSSDKPAEPEYYPAKFEVQGSVDLTDIKVEPLGLRAFIFFPEVHFKERLRFDSENGAIEGNIDFETAVKPTYFKLLLLDGNDPVGMSQSFRLGKGEQSVIELGSVSLD